MNSRNQKPEPPADRPADAAEAAPDISGRLSEAEREQLRQVLGQVAEAASKGHPTALQKMSEILVDDSLLAGFDRRDHGWVLRQALKALEQSVLHLRTPHFWALVTALDRPGVSRGAYRVLKLAVEADKPEAIAMLRTAVRTPGMGAERAADLLAKIPDKLQDLDRLAIGVRALQAARPGPARRYLEREFARAEAPAIQAVRTMLWRHKPFVDLDHEEARLQAALVMVGQPEQLNAEDLPHLREAALRAGGEQLVTLYCAADDSVDRQPPMEGALETYAGILNDAELGDDPERGSVLEPLARPRVMERFGHATCEFEHRRALAPLALLWSWDAHLRAEAIQLLQRPALDGDSAAIAAAAMLCSLPERPDLAPVAEQVLQLLEAASRSGHSVATVSRLLDELQRGEVQGVRLFEAIQRCAAELPAGSPLRSLLIQTLRGLAQDSPHAVLARRTLNHLIVDPELAEQVTMVREVPAGLRGRAKVRSGLSGKTAPGTPDRDRDDED